MVKLPKYVQVMSFDPSHHCFIFCFLNSLLNWPKYIFLLGSFNYKFRTTYVPKVFLLFLYYWLSLICSVWFGFTKFGFDRYRIKIKLNSISVRFVCLLIPTTIIISKLIECYEQINCVKTKKCKQI